MGYYTINQLRKLADIRSENLDSWCGADKSDKAQFDDMTELFFDWVEEMEKEGKINELLNI